MQVSIHVPFAIYLIPPIYACTSTYTDNKSLTTKMQALTTNIPQMARDGATLLACEDATQEICLAAFVSASPTYQPLLGSISSVVVVLTKVRQSDLGLILMLSLTVLIEPVISLYIHRLKGHSVACPLYPQPYY